MRIYLTISDLLRTPDDFALIVERHGAGYGGTEHPLQRTHLYPFTHTDYQDKGLTIDNLLDGLEAGRKAAHQASGVEMRWVFDIARNTSFGDDGRYDPHPAERTLEYALRGREFGVIGLGLGGFEVGAPPEPFAHAFADAKTAGLFSVPHAGETVGPSSVWGAIDALQADRIGHGVRAIEDPALLVALRDRQIPLEMNPTSNVCLHVYNRAAVHPFPHLDRMGLKVTVNSDDPPLFNTTLNDEFNLLAAEFGYGAAGLARIARNAFEVCAAPDTLKSTLLAEFDAWAAHAVPEAEAA
ncbi:MAG: adenosine deaminase family protein [Caldilineaceae bacterium]|nr:adenosine deaminase family protein [Caldilineaceae bacterium]